MIVDEGHNLKHGFRTGVAARNRVLALAFGRSLRQIDGRLFPGYGKRAKRVLFLSATPIEEPYEQLWNQLDVFGLGGPFSDLKRRDATDEEKKKVAAQFLVRRVTTATVNGQRADQEPVSTRMAAGRRLAARPAHLGAPTRRNGWLWRWFRRRSRSCWALASSTCRFQIGMLASFESFLQTAKLRR